jgi:hypothetical protein
MGKLTIEQLDVLKQGFWKEEDARKWKDNETDEPVGAIPSEAAFEAYKEFVIDRDN